MEEIVPVFTLFNGKLGFTEGIIVQWAIIILFFIFSKIFVRNLKENPDKRQSVLEIIVEYINNLVKDNMGEKRKGFAPFIGALAAFILLMNLSGMVGIAPPTRDLSITLSLGAVVFIVIQAYTIKEHGIKEYFVGYTKPVAVILPINIMERIMLPISLSLRLFGNIAAATIIIELIYDSLGNIGWIAQIGIPIPFHFYFDIFDGAIQMLIFIMLTMINIKIIAEH
ncbi:F0F1 ATP synthase subunit A [Clostridium grantii]|uniref:ATP synthase subunit a n=1 Tax=Clostridium grantii DSM 8605 TaxID=1121316 RepID=A0A1M5TJA2_9CLOT|nr:F0F1 ATP synthase subunit A [Clostridium grantii]SHH50766.1 ATP synthase F0 subcomplex A subunit [Clostridium grantii DSM 8605]